MIMCSNTTHIHSLSLSLSLSQKSTESHTHTLTQKHTLTHKHTHKTKYFLCYKNFKCNNNEIKDIAWFILVVINLPSSTAPLLISMHDENNLQYNINRNPEIFLQINHAKSFISSYQHLLHFRFRMFMWVQLGSPHTVASAFNERRTSFVVWPIRDLEDTCHSVTVGYETGEVGDEQSETVFWRRECNRHFVFVCIKL